jgi:tRNA modification GTPase
MDTIAAIATPPGQGAIAVLRVSGPEAIAVADRVFKAKRKPSEIESRVQSLGAICDDDTQLDSVLLTVFRKPSSFTGEDVVEIACHGGVLVTRRILELLLRNGASLADPGEFTRRAFLNGKLDLTQAEAIMDLIGASSDRALRAATEQLEGTLGSQIRAMQSEMLGLLAHIEAYIDFPEEDISPDTGSALLQRLEAILKTMESLLASASQGRLIREGVRTVISGPPNAGKSSLLNRLLGFERAIVSATPGTTRDTLEESVILRGWSLRLVDTAGLRESLDPIELEGINRAMKQRAEADLILHVRDGALPAQTISGTGCKDEKAGSEEILILNKSDIEEHPSWADSQAIRISCLSGRGVRELEEAIDTKLTAAFGAGLESESSGFVVINARHQDCLRRGVEQTQAAQSGLKESISPEFVAEELRGALHAVGEIVGQTDTEDLLGQIFSTFCIGK